MDLRDRRGAVGARVDVAEHLERRAPERARPELRALVERATHAGTETGRQAAHLMKEFTFSGIELAGQFSVRFAQMASGVLAGMADALEKSATDKKQKP